MVITSNLKRVKNLTQLFIKFRSNILPRFKNSIEPVIKIIIFRTRFIVKKSIRLNILSFNSHNIFIKRMPKKLFLKMKIHLKLSFTNFLSFELSFRSSTCNFIAFVKQKKLIKVFFPHNLFPFSFRLFSFKKEWKHMEINIKQTF